MPEITDFTNYSYDFYATETIVAVTSAAQVLPVVLQETRATSVIDVGCGTGGWAYIAETLGCQPVTGVDLNVPETMRLIAGYIDQDLTNGFNCGDWDLAICLEVAEHLPFETGPKLVAGLAKADMAVLFSGATPGQPGVGHINCQVHEYWHDLFAEHGMTPEYMGDQFDEPVADFYRRNMHLYTRP